MSIPDTCLSFTGMSDAILAAVQLHITGLSLYSVTLCRSVVVDPHRSQDVVEVNCNNSFIGLYYVVYCSLPRRFCEVGKTCGV